MQYQYRSILYFSAALLNFFFRQGHPVDYKLRYHTKNRPKPQHRRLILSKAYGHRHTIRIFLPPVRYPAYNSLIRGDTSAARFRQASSSRSFSLFASYSVSAYRKRHMAHFALVILCSVSCQKCKWIILFITLYQMKKNTLRCPEMLALLCQIKRNGSLIS